MKLPFVYAMQTKIIGRSPSPVPMWASISYSEEIPGPGGAADDFLDYRSSAEVFFRQIAPANAAEHIQKSAVRAMARHVYGPVEAELRDILECLWRDGMHHSEAAKKIEAMIPVLRGEAG